MITCNGSPPLDCMLDDAEGAQSSQALNKQSGTVAMSFSNLIDEPESKKLAAQSDLDSAKALCEFPLLLYALFTFGTIMLYTANPACVYLRLAFVLYSCYSSFTHVCQCPYVSVHN